MSLWELGRAITIVTLIATLAVVARSEETVSNEGKLFSQFTQAIRRADVFKVERMLTKHPTLLRSRDSRRWTPLMHAAFYADADCLRLFLKGSEDVNATNNSGATALHYSVTNLEKAQLLVAAGADVNAATHLGNTPLMLAARSSQSSAVVKLLLGNRANVHARNIFGVTALMVASSSDDVETVRLLLDRGADPRHVPYVNVFSKHGQRIDAFFGGGVNALTWASIKGNREIAELLLDAHADVNAPSPFGLTLSAAVQNNQTDIARLLLERGARVEDTPAGDGWTALMWAAANENGDADLVKLLLANGANVNAAKGDRWGPQMSMPHTPLMIARRRGETDIVKALVEAGANDVKDPWDFEQKNPPKRGFAENSGRQEKIVASVSAAIPLLERTALESLPEFDAHDQRCNSCHSQLLPLVALNFAKEKCVPHNGRALSRLVDLISERTSEVEVASKVEATVEPGPASFLGYFLWGMYSHSAASDFVFDAAVHHLAVSQSRDGSWPQPFPRPPMIDSNISTTALGIRALTLNPLPGRQKQIDDSVLRARRWLGNSNPKTTEDRVYKLLGLYWADETKENLAPLVGELRSLQRLDGGWSQLPGLESDAYATGQVVYALQEAGRLSPKEDVVQNGLFYLLQDQCADGSWFVRRRAYPFQPTMDAKFPHGRDAWISTAATCWAVMALTVGLDKQDVMEVLSVSTDLASTKPINRSPELPPPSAVAIDYDKHILPVLESSCLDCHSSGDPAGLYAMDVRESLIKGGFSGPPVVVSGNGAESPLVLHVAGLIEDVEMPPLARRDEYEPLSDEEIGLLRAWIDQGLPGLSE